MKRFLLSASLILAVSVALAQSGGRISGSISENGRSVDGATASLLRAKDSSTVKLSASDKQGRFAFEGIADGNYLVSISAIGRQKAFSGLVQINPQQQSVELPVINLVAASKDLTAVTVSAKRPLVEQRIDRTVVNVDASVTNVGTSALEVLEKSPGVSVDRDGNVSLKGKDGVMIMVDGRPTQLSGPDLANLLRNMSSNQLDQIEIMTNPPARYDAAGNAGIINIKTKKTAKAGINGSANFSVGQGRYSKTSEGFNFNYREGKVNLFTNLSHSYQKRFQDLQIDRNIFSGNTGAIDKVFSQGADRVTTSNSYNAKAGIDFFASKKTTLGAVIGLNTRPGLAMNPNVTLIYNSAKDLQSITRAMVRNEMDWNSFNTNLNFRRLIGAKGKELTADLDFLKYGSATDMFMVNSYTDAPGNAYRKADSLRGDLPQDITVYSGRIDYLYPVKKDMRFEAGIKSSIVRTDNDASYDSIQYGKIVHDFNRSNHFLYEENINAAYVNLSTPLSKKISAQFGLRLENTNAKGRQLTTSQNFDRHYTQLFPTAYFQYKADEKNNFGANFGRRVRRPGYQNLNPFIRFLDRYTYSQGNPNLKPSVSSNFEIAHTWKNLITTTLNYTSTKDVMQDVTQQKGDEAYDMPSNVASLKQYGISVNTNLSVNKWWTSSINLNLFNDNYKGVISNVPVDLSATGFIINGTQQFKINPVLTAELSGAYRSGWLEGVVRIRPVGMVHAGLSRQVLKNKGTIRLSARDVFHTQRLKGRSLYGNVDFSIRQVSETQVVTLGFTYAFSKGKKIAPVKRTAGSAGEEQNRIGQ